MQAISLDTPGNVIRYCHVFGLSMRHLNAPRASMEIRGPGPNQFSGLSALTHTTGFPGPVSMIVCPYLSSVLLTSTTPSRQAAATQAAAVTGSR